MQTLFSYSVLSNSQKESFTLTKPLKAIDLFAGIGGIRLGFIL